ncbi:hypothetical protein NVP1103O_77 [Vibrio phage 1.103.O._10N.261.52.F2]|nr:hypothetical protein NVP1103O_77 [Vibrio phage 1.103.O._10N.261.52.F2]
MTVPMHEDSRYGRLTLISSTPYRIKDRTNLHYRCVCDCGRSLLVSGTHLRQGRVMSCGCLQKESQHKNLTTSRPRVICRFTIHDAIRHT